MTNQRMTVLYVGISSNLPNRNIQHKNKTNKGFTEKYNINKLVYYECFDNPIEAINREKEVKKWRREKKINLIKTMNPEFKDLDKEWLRFWTTGCLGN